MRMASRLVYSFVEDDAEKEKMLITYSFALLVNDRPGIDDDDDDSARVTVIITKNRKNLK